MKQTLAWLTLVMAPSLAQAQADSVGGFFELGASGSTFSVTDDDPQTFKLDFDDGGGASVAGGIRFKPGLMVRANYDRTRYDGGSDCTIPGSCVRFDDRLTRSESRLGVFFAPQITPMVGVRAGLGWQWINYEIRTTGFDMTEDGLFVEVAGLFNVGRIVTFEAGGAVSGLQNDNDEDVGGAEYLLGAIFHTGPVDIGVHARGQRLETKFQGGGKGMEEFSSFLVSVGTHWGYAGEFGRQRRPARDPGRRRY